MEARRARRGTQAAARSPWGTSRRVVVSSPHDGDPLSSSTAYTPTSGRVTWSTSSCRRTSSWICFAGRPEADVLYGAFLVDDPDRILRTAAGAMPQLYFHPYDHRAVAQDNVADISCIAHRAGLAEA